MSTLEALCTLMAAAAATFLTRSLPFLLFPAHKKTPKYVVYLGKVLPCATIGMLILYCVKAVAPFAWPHGLPEAISVGAVAVIQWWKRNTLLSIVSGTALYMLLVQMVFTQA